MQASLSLQAGLFGFGEQVPIAPVTSHAWHWPVHAVSQQTPLTQNPPAHCVPVVHVRPSEGS